MGETAKLEVTAGLLSNELFFMPFCTCHRLCTAAADLPVPSSKAFAAHLPGPSLFTIWASFEASSSLQSPLLGFLDAFGLVAKNGEGSIALERKYCSETAFAVRPVPS